jgi:dTDP-4-dehydrorhamnose 3,5-epimerase
VFDLVESALPGCRLLLPRFRDDRRGRFVKSFHAEFFAAHDMADVFREQYYSVSSRGVLRGLHFQVPPHDHAKLVICLAGEIFDAVVDLRVGSPEYGRHEQYRLTAERGEQLYIPSGMAHGFYVLSEQAVVLYGATSVYAPEHDTGLRWDSVDIEWPDDSPEVSDRDRALPRFAEFESPFRHRPGGLAGEI